MKDPESPNVPFTIIRTRFPIGKYQTAIFNNLNFDVCGVQWCTVW